jgi:hypothetical protein
MDLKSVCLFLGRKYEIAQEVYDEINKVLGEHMIGYSIVTQNLHLTRFGDIPVKALQISCLSVVNHTILTDLDEVPFSSVRELAKASCFSPTTVCRHLTQSLGVTVRRLHRVPQALTEAQMHCQVDLSHRLLAQLGSVQASPNQYIIMLDEF